MINSIKCAARSPSPWPATQMCPRRRAAAHHPRACLPHHHTPRPQPAMREWMYRARTRIDDDLGAVLGRLHQSLLGHVRNRRLGNLLHLAHKCSDVMDEVGDVPAARRVAQCRCQPRSTTGPTAPASPSLMELLCTQPCSPCAPSPVLSSGRSSSARDVELACTSGSCSLRCSDSSDGSVSDDIVRLFTH